MVNLLQDNVILLIIALLIGLFVAWFVLNSSRKTKVERAPDEADAKPGARRNQALIDAPAAVAADPAIAAQTLARMPDAEPVATKPADVAPPPLSGAVPSAAAVPAGHTETDDLCRIKGVGPKLKAQLHDLGINSFAQIAAWDAAEIDRIDAQLGRFQGRIRRDDWPQQARLLAAGDTAGYETRFGKL